MFELNLRIDSVSGNFDIDDALPAGQTLTGESGAAFAAADVHPNRNVVPQTAELRADEYSVGTVNIPLNDPARTVSADTRNAALYGSDVAHGQAEPLTIATSAVDAVGMTSFTDGITDCANWTVQNSIAPVESALGPVALDSDAANQQSPYDLPLFVDLAALSVTSYEYQDILISRTNDIGWNTNLDQEVHAFNRLYAVSCGTQRSHFGAAGANG